MDNLLICYLVGVVVAFFCASYVVRGVKPMFGEDRNKIGKNDILAALVISLTSWLYVAVGIGAALMFAVAYYVDKLTNKQK